MGEVVIEMPFKGKRRFRITDAKAAEEVIEKLESLEKKSRGRPPENITDDDVLRVWANRKETPDEIARRLRQGNSQHG